MTCPGCGYDAGPVLLDAYSGAGGAARGYALAGFHPFGVDHRAQPRYPYCFRQGDALDALGEVARGGWKPAAIHASPPCQRYSRARTMHTARAGHPDLVAPTRAALQDTGLPWVMENVVNAPLAGMVRLCGTSFGLVLGEWELQRHRLFEVSGFWVLSPPCQHDPRRRVLGVYGNGGGQINRDPKRGRYGSKADAAQARAIMGCPWMTRREVTQAIPPAYTEYIGNGLMEWMT